MKSIDLSGIDLNLLVAFEALYIERSVTGAAQRIHVGQPAMSAALGRLRSLFADDLFVRVRREMKPTVKAVAIAPQVAAALDTIRATLADLQTFDPAQSQQIFTIATSDYFASLVLPELLMILSDRAPQVDLRLLPVDKSSIADVLEDGLVDVALGTFTDLPPYIMQENLLPERFVGISRVGHPAFEQGAISLEKFVAFPHALFTLRRDAVGAIDQALAQQGLQRRISLTVPYWFALPNAIASSDLLAAIPACLEMHLTKHYPLQSFEIPLDLSTWSVSMVWSRLSDRDSANLWLRQMIQQACQKILTASDYRQTLQK